jgi:hypothetical protein
MVLLRLALQSLGILDEPFKGPEAANYRVSGLDPILDHARVRQTTQSIPEPQQR